MRLNFVILCCLFCSSFQIKAPRNSFRASRSLRMSGEYSDKVKGGTAGKYLFSLALAALVRSQLSSIDVRTTTVCPSGFNAERSLRIFQENDPDFHCLPLGEFVKTFVTSRIVLPGDPDFDTNFFRMEARGLKTSQPIRGGDRPDKAELLKLGYKL